MLILFKTPSKLRAGRDCKGRGGGIILPYHNSGGVLTSVSGLVAPVVAPVVSDEWPARRQTFPARVSPPFDRYHVVLLHDRGTRV